MNTQFDVAARREDAVVPEPKWPARYARFGKFHVDLEKEELYEFGKRARIQTKVYQALLALLSQPGEIVTREEVCKRLWPDMQVNFDANVNTTINKLRLMLADSPENPVYIETVPRRGYSFIAAVEFSDKPVVPKLDPMAVAGHAEASGSVVNWSQLFRPAALRVVGFVLAGMLAGAMLVLAWSFVTSKAKAHRADNVGRQNALMAPVSGTQTASVPPAQSNHKM